MDPSAEIIFAIDFLMNLLKTKLKDVRALDVFCGTLYTILQREYNGHWFPENSMLGNAYRSIHTQVDFMDPRIREACFCSGLEEHVVAAALPVVLTIWIDPREVSYRFGRDGSICNNVIFPSIVPMASGIPDMMRSPHSSPYGSPNVPRKHKASPRSSRKHPKALALQICAPPVQQNLISANAKPFYRSIPVC